MIYYDNAATTKVYPECIEILTQYNQNRYFNPSALYKEASDIKLLIDGARKKKKKRLRAPEGNLYFTSSGSEADNTALFGVRKQKGQTVIVGEGEHDAVYNSALQLKNDGFNVEFAPIKSDGGIDIEKLADMLNPNVCLVSVMHVSNETGAIHDLESISALIKEKAPRAIFHSDGVQAYGKIDINLRASGVDMYTISGHKIHAPKGVGALWIKKGDTIRPLIFGGGQESGFRSSTENVAGIMAFKTASDRIFGNFEENNSIKSQIKEYLKSYICQNVADTVVLSPDDGASHILTLAFKNLRGEVLLHALEKKSVLVGIGSACSSHRESRFKKLLNLDADHRDGIVRLSFSEFNTLDEAKEAAKIIADTANEWNRFVRK